MCFPKNKKGRPLVPPKKAASPGAAPPSQTKANPSTTKITSAPATGPAVPATTSPSDPQAEVSAKEKTCNSESDLMQISAYKNPKKKDSGSGPIGSKPPEDANSPEVFENNAQIESLNPVNVTQIFVDSVVPQTNMSKMQSDVIDQNTLEHVEPKMEDQVFDLLNSGEEHHAEVPQARPRANALLPEEDSIPDNSFSERQNRPSEKRARASTARAERRVSTPDRLPAVFTPPPPTKSEKVFQTCKRAVRGPISTRTAAASRQRTSVRHVEDSGAIDNTAPSHEPTSRERHRRPATTEYRTVVQTAMPIEPKDATCGSREAADSTATARKTTTVAKPPPPSCMSNVNTAHIA